MQLGHKQSRRMSAARLLTLSPKKKTDVFADNVGLDEAAHYEPSLSGSTLFVLQSVDSQT